MNKSHNTSLNFTEHAMVRAQQRGFRVADLELVMRHGSAHYDHRGARVWTLTKKVISKLSSRMPGSSAHLDRLSDAYVVESVDGSITTVGHRYRRLPNRG